MYLQIIMNYSYLLEVSLARLCHGVDKSRMRHLFSFESRPNRNVIYANRVLAKYVGRRIRRCSLVGTICISTSLHSFTYRMHEKTVPRYRNIITLTPRVRR